MAWLVEDKKQQGIILEVSRSTQGRRTEAVVELPYLVLPFKGGFWTAFLGPPL